MTDDPRIAAMPDIHGHAKGEHKPFAEERPIPYTARMLFLWFFHACRRGSPRFVMVADHMNYLTFEDPAAVNLVRRALKLAQAGDLYGAAETAGVELGHAAAVCDGLRKGMRYSIGAEIDNDPRCRPDAQNIVDAMRPDGMIRSIHFLPITHPQHGENWMWAFDNPEFRDLYEVVGTERVWQIYMDTLIEAIAKLPGHIVGHFYVPAKFGHWPDDATLESYEDRLLDACAERGLAIEINSRFFYKHYAQDDEQLARYRAAHLRLLRKAAEKGVMIAVGSDAHSPKDQGAGFDAVLALLDEANINEIAFPINGRLARVALRATEELRRQAAALIAAPAAPHGAPADDDATDEPPVESIHPAATEVATASLRRENGAPSASQPPQVRAKPAQRPARPHRTPPAVSTATGEQQGGTAPSALDQPASVPEVTGDDQVAVSPPSVTKRPARKRPSRAAAPAAPADASVAAAEIAPAKVRDKEAPPAPVQPVKPATAPLPMPTASVETASTEPALSAAAPAKKSRTGHKPGSRPAALVAASKRPASTKKTTVSRSRAKTAAAKTASKKTAAKRPDTKRAAVKKTAARKQAAAPAGRPVKKAALRKAVKPVKRAAPKRVAAKPGAAKKSAAKRKAKPRR
ncbi:MAG: hypothetical protein M3R53_08120 [Candidatus Eremiobacteraeota bacterium]|nr:hypothetical protein [Candidatus Eremiobacteraeota bacterium]